MSHGWGKRNSSSLLSVGAPAIRGILPDLTYPSAGRTVSASPDRFGMLLCERPCGRPLGFALPPAWARQEPCPSQSRDLQRRAAVGKPGLRTSGFVTESHLPVAKLVNALCGLCVPQSIPDHHRTIHTRLPEGASA